MKHLSALLALASPAVLLVAAGLVPDRAPADPPDDVLPVTEEKALLGDDLDDWVFYSPKSGAKKADVFQLHDGILSVSGRPAGYLETKLWYRDYELELEWRWPEGARGGNSGVLVHTTAPLIFFGWPRSMEVQLASGNAGDFWVIGRGVDIRVEDEDERRAKPRPGDAHTHRRIANLTDGSEKPIGEWNRMRVRCMGDEVMVWVNGVLVNHGTASTIREGAIALQSEGRPLEFRNVKIGPLEESAGR